jgi:ribulose-5-phosphate 4-epimerase/fuculose-1-phosphate aldolase
MTPTDACLGFLDPGELSRLDADGRHVSGPKPSKTQILHRWIYRAAGAWQPGIRCVIHTHSHACVLLSLLGADGPGSVPGVEELIPPITPYFVMKVGHVPVLEYDRPGSPAVADRVERLIGDYGRAGAPLQAFMLPRLGPNVWHDSPAAAMAVLEELEETARLWLACRNARGGVSPLDAAQLESLGQAFGRPWLPRSLPSATDRYQTS